jgi:hypothetical protein
MRTGNLGSSLRRILSHRFFSSVCFTIFSGADSFSGTIAITTAIKY